jgi:hypothetical protein
VTSSSGSSNRFDWSLAICSGYGSVTPARRAPAGTPATTSPRQTPLVPLLVDRLLETLLVVTVAVVVLLLVRERRTTGPPPIGSIGTRGAALATHRVLLSRSGQTLH